MAIMAAKAVIARAIGRMASTAITAAKAVTALIIARMANTAITKAATAPDTWMGKIAATTGRKVAGDLSDPKLEHPRGESGVFFYCQIHFAGAAFGQSSVLNGEAGRPSLL